MDGFEKGATLNARVGTAANPSIGSTHYPSPAHSDGGEGPAAAGYAGRLPHGGRRSDVGSRFAGR